jgi:hypothetical protein
MKASQLSRKRRTLLIGDSSTGKTYQLGTWVKRMEKLGGSSKVVTADAEGLDTFRQMGVDPDVELVEDWGSIWTLYSRLKKWAAGPEATKVLLLDDLGALQEVAKNYVADTPWSWEEKRQKQREPGAYAAQVEQARMQGNRQFQQVHWGMLLGMEEFLRKVLKELPLQYWVFTVREQMRRHPRSGRDRIYPALQGATRDWLMAQCSLVVSTFVHYEQGKTSPIFCASSLPHPSIGTKDRYQAGRTWAFPTAERIIAHIEGKDGETEQEKKIGIGV